MSEHEGSYDGIGHSDTNEGSFDQDLLGASSRLLLENMERLIDKRLDDEGGNRRFDFKKKGNQAQFDINSKVEKHLQSAQKHLSCIEKSSTDRSVGSIAKRAGDDLHCAMNELSHRNKMIKLADGSHGGWATVSEYETHELADNSEDERRIIKAESRAMRKIKEAQKRRTPQRTRATSTVTQSQPTTERIDTVQGVRGRRPGCCFTCGKPGHWRSDCMALKPSGSSADTAGALNTLQPKISNIGNVNICNKSVVPEKSKIVNQIGCLSNVSNINSPLGRLKCNYRMWSDSKANSFVLDVIHAGYKLPFLTIPPRTSLKNNASVLKNHEFVISEISKLLDLGLITNTDLIPEVVNPLTVACNNPVRKGWFLTVDT